MRPGMSWTKKQFHSEATFQAPRHEVAEAARAVMAALVEHWRVEDTSDGFQASGYSGAHKATANFHVVPWSGGAKVTVDLLVDRFSSTGFMIFDVGGYYNRQLRKWLQAIQWELHNQGASQAAPEQLAQKRSATACVANGCLLLIVAVFVLDAIATCIFAVVGLFTGKLLVIGRGGSFTMHGPWARIVSAIILAVAVLLVIRYKRWSARKARESSA
jgi:hypothetical protein